MSATSPGTPGRSRARRHGARRSVLALVLAAGVSVSGSAHAGAAALGSWADWAPLAGSSGSWASSASFSVNGLGPVSVASTSAGGAVGVIEGATRWLGPATPPGALFGSSEGRPYLNLANSTGGNASVTTYTFAQAAPAGAWAIVLGDVDLETLTISATGPTGTALTATELGWAGGFNYCAGAGAPSCTASDSPTQAATTTSVTLTGAGTNTDGAAGWLRPTAPVKQLTISAQRLASTTGIQIHQVWLAAFSRDLSGTVTGPDGTGVAGARLTVHDSSGTVLATGTSGPTGAYRLSNLPAAGATLTITPPDGLLVAGAATRTIDLTGADAVQDVVLRAPVAVTATGAVEDTTGTPVPGATITLTQGTTTLTATSQTDGTWTSPTLTAGTWNLTTTAPTGWTVVSGSPTSLTVDAADEGTHAVTPVIVRTLVAVTATGSVVDTTGTPVPGATITLTQGTTTLTATSRTDGTWTSPTLTTGTWTLTATAPAGWVVTAAPSALTVAAGDEGTTTTTPVSVRKRVAVTATGTVVDTTGTPVPGATITLTDGTTTVSTTTAADGTWTSPTLTTGTWTLTVTAPAGWTLRSAPEAIVVDADDEGAAAAPDAVIELVPTGPEPVAPTTPEVTDPSVVGSLAATGAAPARLAALAAALVSAGLVLTVGSRRAVTPPARHVRSRRRRSLGR